MSSVKPGKAVGVLSRSSHFEFSAERRLVRGNPQRVIGNGVFGRKTQNTVLGTCGILVFWYSGLALAETRFLSWEAAFLRQKSRIPVGRFCLLGWCSERRGLGDAGTVCSWHVAVWILRARTRVVACGDARFLPAAPTVATSNLKLDMANFKPDTLAI